MTHDGCPYCRYPSLSSAGGGRRRALRDQRCLSDCQKMLDCRYDEIQHCYDGVLADDTSKGFVDTWNAGGGSVEDDLRNFLICRVEALGCDSPDRAIRNWAVFALVTAGALLAVLVLVTGIIAHDHHQVKARQGQEEKEEAGAAAATEKVQLPARANPAP
jgi:hypothetical protein